MNERFIRKQLFQIGQFYQLNSFNPVYLDKTGELIAISEGLLKNWNGNMNDFHFSDQKRPYTGKVNMNNFWYNNPRQGEFDNKELQNFCKFIKETNILIDSVYKPKYYTRIGLRIQFILRKTAEHVREKYRHFFDDNFEKLKSYGSFNTTALGFDIEGKNLNIKVNINYAKRNSENDLNAPKEGLFFDLDFFKVIAKKTSEETFLISDNIIEFALSNYKEIVCEIAEEMGIISEE